MPEPDAPSRKIRLDELLVDRGLAENRTRANALIVAGAVFSGGKRLDKPGHKIPADTPIEVRGKTHPWVSRGGVKLAHGLEYFKIDPAGLTCLDIGASTGGFTDVLLRRGAKRVYAVDVGHGQFDWTLRNDPRVVVLEKTNARALDATLIPDAPGLIACDASFIGLEVVLPASLKLAAPGARLIALIKPQFEVGKGKVGKKGVVREPELHREVCARISAWLSARPGWRVLGVTESPITGPEGNKEFLIAAAKDQAAGSPKMTLSVTVKLVPRRADSGPDSGPVDSLIRAGRIDEALAHCRRALRERPDDPVLLRDAADVSALQGRYREALAFYRRAAARSPVDQDVHELLAAVHWKLGEAEEGQRVLRRFFRDHPVRVWDQGPGKDPGKDKDASRTILRLAGMDGTLCRLEEKPNRRPRPHYRGGHFLTTHLLPPRRYRVLTWTVAENNLNRRDDIPAHDLLLNTIADADIEPRSLAALSEYLGRHPMVPIVNHPDRVLETTRDGNAGRLNALAGVVFPRTARFRRDGANPEAAAARIGEMGFAYPIIVRETGTHTGRTVALVGDEGKLTRYFAGVTGEEFYLIQFVDERFTGADGKPYFNKKRVFCIDGRLYPVVSHVDTVWNVHGHNRLTVMQRNPWMQEQEKNYLADPMGAIGAKNWRVLASLGSLVGLDFFGVDYTVRRDGTLLIFELNAAMRHSHAHARNFPYMRPFMDRIGAAFAAMLERKLKGVAGEVGGGWES